MTTDASGSLTAGAADSTDIHRTGSGEPTASASRSASRSSLPAKVPTFWLASPDSAPISSRPTGWAGDVGAGSDGKAGWSTAISMGFADGVFAGDSDNGDWFTEVTSPEVTRSTTYPDLRLGLGVFKLFADSHCAPVVSAHAAVVYVRVEIASADFACCVRIES